MDQTIPNIWINCGESPMTHTSSIGPLTQHYIAIKYLFTNPVELAGGNTYTIHFICVII